MTETIFTVAALHEHRDCAQFTTEGLAGANRQTPDRPVSLMSLDARREVDQAVARGLCYRRFKADITLVCDQMPPTDARLKSGDLILVILQERKKCWPECELWQDHQPCPLIEGVRYARVESPGSLCLNDHLEVSTTP